MKDLCAMLSNLHHRDVFERLRNGETILPNDPEALKLRDASYATKKLLLQRRLLKLLRQQLLLHFPQWLRREVL